MHRKKWVILVFLICLPLLLFLKGCSTGSLSQQSRAVEGKLDLTEIQIDEEIINLDGQWEFYWNMLLEPKDFESNSFLPEYINIPGSWNKHIINDKELSSDGYATYRLLFKIEEDKKLGLKIPRIFTSYKLWVNGEMIAHAGRIGQSRETMVPQYLPQAALFESRQGMNEIVIQVSNYYHRSGGILESIKLGSANQILDKRYKGIAYELFLFGSLIIIGIYQLFLFFFRTKNRSPLYFGLFCMFIAIRTLLVGERFFIYLFPNFNWEVAHKIQTMAFYLGVPIIVTFFMSVFPKYFNRRLVKIIELIGIGFSALVLLTPARIFTVVNPAYQTFAFAAVAYLIITFIKIILGKEKDVWLIIVGGLFLILTSLNDIVFLSIWMNDYNIPILRTIIRTSNLSSVGQFIFVFTNSLMLAKRFSKSMEHEEVMTTQLKEINLNLDKLVKNRTKALDESRKRIEQQKFELEQANQKLQLLSLKDPLTGLWNRRHYDLTIVREWQRCLRQKRPVSILMLDVDFFKQYNDFYGHNEGDECLVLIAQTLKSLFKRSTDWIFRYGGEEFVIIMVDCGKDEALRMAQLVRKSIEDLNIPHQYSSVSPWVTASIGVTSIIPDNKYSYKEFFQIVDKALYKAKEAGKNQVVFLPPRKISVLL
ncbi:MAG: diguanylate cyclase [Mahellales bacterium]